MPTLYIHIGHEKTGTTTIQRFFHDNRVKMKESGLLYPEIGHQNFVQSALVNCIHDLDNGCFLEFFPKGVNVDPHKEWGALVNMAKVWQKNILISSEHFMSRLGRAGITFIKDYLAKNLPEYDIKIISFLRRQDEMFISRLSTLAKAGAKAPYQVWKDQVLQKNIYYDYLNLIGRWSDVFGNNNIELIPYRKGTDSISEIMKVLNINDDSMKLPERFNTSWDAITIAIGFKINALCSELGYSEKNKKLELLNKYILHSNVNNNRISRNLIDYGFAKEIIDTYSEDNVILSDRFSDSKNLFSSMLSKDDFFGSIDDLSDEESLNLVFGEGK